MEDLGHLIETLLEMKASSVCLDDVVLVSNCGATGEVLRRQRIEAKGGQDWDTFPVESRALAPHGEAVHLAGARGGVGGSSAHLDTAASG